MLPTKDPWVAASQNDHSDKTAIQSIQADLSVSVLNQLSTTQNEPNESLDSGHASLSSRPTAWNREVGKINLLCRAILDTLAYLVTLPVVTSGSRKDRNALQRCHATLKLWTNGHHVWKGELDQALEESQDLRHATLSVLLSLCISLQLGLRTHGKTAPEDRAAAHLLDSISTAREVAEALLKDSDQPTSDTDSSDDDEFEDDFCDNGIGRMAEEIKTFTNCLLDLSAALERPALDANHADVVSRTQHDSLTDTGVSEPTEPSSLPVESWSTSSWIHYNPPVLGKMEHKSMHVGIPKKDVPMKSHTKRSQLIKRVFQCPFRKAQGKLGLLPYTCTAVPVTTVAAIQTHLTCMLPGGEPHLSFLRLCPTCREYALDEHEFKTFHGESGLECEVTEPQLKGDSTVEQILYDSLYSKVEAYIVAQSLNVPLASAARPDLHQRLLSDDQDTPHSRTHSHAGEDQDGDFENAPPSP